MHFIAVLLLFFWISFLNYMNRFTTPPIISRLKNDFHVEDTVVSLIQSCFEIFYVLSAPVFGFLGDRFSRRYIMATTLSFTAVVGLSSSFIPSNSFLLLLTTRAVLGVGEACSTTVCPSLIGDMFTGRRRTLALCVYQLGIPLGCGVGFMLAGVAADFADDWRWAFRLTPLPTAMVSIFLIAFFRDPERGEAEQSSGLHKTTSFQQDFTYLMKIPSFILASLANVGAAFATCALTFWAPDLILRMLAMKGHNYRHSEAQTGLIFGAVTIASGIVGVVVGASVSSLCLKPHFGPVSDCIVSGAAMFLAAPILFAGLVCIPIDVTTTWLLIFFGIAAMSCCYVLLSEITLNVVIETRRATARSYQSTISHLLGDAASPWLSGLISEQVKEYYKTLNPGLDAITPDEEAIKIADFTSMQTTLYLSTLVVAVSGGLFLCSSFYVNEDVAKTKSSFAVSKQTPEGECSLYQQGDIADDILLKNDLHYSAILQEHQASENTTD